MNKTTLTITDPGNLWVSSNEWMHTERCEEWLLVVILKLEDKPQSLVFGPFDKDGVKLKGMKLWDEESKSIWKDLARGASKENQFRHEIWYRYIQLPS
jgi:hypothetical protein